MPVHVMGLAEADEHGRATEIPKPELMWRTAQEVTFVDMALYEVVHNGFG
jgi:hypothetical protein